MMARARVAIATISALLLLCMPRVGVADCRSDICGDNRQCTSGGYVAVPGAACSDDQGGDSYNCCCAVVAWEAEWSNAEVTDVGSAGLVHGPWGNDATDVSATVALPTDVTQCRVSWRSWVIDSRDGETDRVLIDGAEVWSKAAHFDDLSDGCSGGWAGPGPADFPNPWGGHMLCFLDVSVVVPCSGALTIRFLSDINQAESDEAWAFSEVAVSQPAQQCSDGAASPAQAPCAFPFTYQGRTYNACTGDNHSQLWCSTDATYAGGWGNCVACAGGSGGSADWSVRDVATLTPRTPCTATLYQHAGFGGWSATFTPGDHGGSEFTRAGAVSDDASSIMVAGGEGCVATVYEHGDLSGWSREFGPGSHDCCEFPNDEASAIRITAPPDPDGGDDDDSTWPCVGSTGCVDTACVRPPWAAGQGSSDWADEGDWEDEEDDDQVNG